MLTVKTITTLLSTFTRATTTRATAGRLYFGAYWRPVISQELLQAAEARCERARAALDDVLLDASPGRTDNGRVLVTRNSQWPQRAEATRVTIHIDGLRVVSALEVWSQQDGYRIEQLRLHDAAEERTIRAERNARMSAIESRFAGHRARIAGELQRGRVPRDVEAIDGQRGGRLVVGVANDRGERDCISIRGALKAAGLAPGEHPYATWCETIADLTQVEPGARVRARDLPPRVRHLRAEHLAG